MERAIQRVQAGDLNGAVRELRQHLTRHPDDWQALRLLGKILFQQGHPDDGMALLKQATHLAPHIPELAYESGVMLLESDNAEEAAEAFRRALTLAPDFTDAAFNLAWTLRRLGRDYDAAQCLRELTARQPGHVEAWFNLGNVLKDIGNSEGAETAYRRVLTLHPNDAKALTNLGALLHSQGQLEQAVEILTAALAADPKEAAAANSLGNALTALGRAEDAIPVYQAMLRHHPRDTALLCNLALALQNLERAADAISYLHTALTIDSSLAEAWNSLGSTLLTLDDPIGAEKALRAALALRPDYADAFSNLGKLMFAVGRPEEAIHSLRDALRIQPNNAAIHSNLLMLLRHLPSLTADQLFEEHLEFGRRQQALATPLPPPLSDAEHSPERLRIGYVSPDFCEHAVMLFFAPVLERHDRRRFEVFCYPSSTRSDAVTARLRGLADHWRPIAHLPAIEAAARIRADGIHILIDLAGHTAGNALPVFAYKPAPIQATWIGYPGTTGLTRIDYRLTDGGADPAHARTERHYAEALHRLPAASIFRPPNDAPTIGPSPLLRHGTPRFGSFNKLAKTNPAVLATWSRLLLAMPTATLLMIVPGGERPDIAEAARAPFRAAGISDQRIDIMGQQPLRRFLELVTEVDVALDPFPYCGGTTSLLTLWMGVPLVCMRGHDSASSTSETLLRGLTLSEFIAENEDAYIDIACRLSQDLARLTELRGSLRMRLTTSPPFDEHALLDGLEHVFEDWWDLWSRQIKAAHPPISHTVSMPSPPPPMADPHWDQVVLLIQGNGQLGSNAFQDERGHFLRPHPAVIQSAAVTLFHPLAACFDGGYLSVRTEADTQFDQDDFTIECWFWMPDHACLGDSGVQLLGQYDHADRPLNGWGLLVEKTGELYGWISSTGYVREIDRILAGPCPSVIPFGRWNHAALIRRKDQLSVAINGKVSTVRLPPNFAVFPSNELLTIGAKGDGCGHRFSGVSYMDDIRISRGVARYDGDFTPPSGPFAAF